MKVTETDKIVELLQAMKRFLPARGENGAPVFPRKIMVRDQVDEVCRRIEANSFEVPDKPDHA